MDTIFDIVCAAAIAGVLAFGCIIIAPVVLLFSFFLFKNLGDE